MQNLSYNDLPQAISTLLVEMASVKQILYEIRKDRDTHSDQWLNLAQLQEYLPDKPSKATIYSLVHNKSIPYHKGAKKLRFLKTEIDAWLKDGGKNTSMSPNLTPESYLKSIKTT